MAADVEASDEISKKASSIVQSGGVTKDVETDKRIHFKVRGETEMHSVIYDKTKSSWECDCRYYTLKGRLCSHVLAAKIFKRTSY
jgi:hypothetical protein